MPHRGRNQTEARERGHEAGTAGKLASIEAHSLLHSHFRAADKNQTQMNIIDILKPECVAVPMQATEKISAITELVDLLATHGQVTDRDELLRAVLQREEETRSTGIGQGLAVPHAKSIGCRSLTIAVGKPLQPIDFASKDRQHCDLIVLLASPVDEMGPHIQALARISRLWLTDSFRAEVAAAQNATQLYQAFLAHQG